MEEDGKIAIQNQGFWSRNVTRYAHANIDSWYAAFPYCRIRSAISTSCASLSLSSFFMRSGAKGGIEQAHTMLRMVLPKKTSFEFLTQWDLRTIVDHINSTPRESLGSRTPYDVALDNYGIDILKALQLRPIPPDEVNLTPKLIRFNH